MIDELKRVLPEYELKTSSSKSIYVVDYKYINGGNVEVLNTEPSDAKSVYIVNILPIKVAYDAFHENALPIRVGVYIRQCECLVFPERDTSNDWILFIETKYTNNLASAFKEENDYPRCMVDQILETVNYFRNCGIIEQNRRVNAIVVFPKLIEEFNSTFFDSLDTTPMKILKDYRVLIRAKNKAKIISHKRIKLGVD